MGQNTASLRTVALVGHGAAGKTTLAETLLAASGAITTRGSVEKGNTVCDFDPQEKELGHSLNSAICSFSWQDAQIHLLDTPGYPDFAGQAIGALAAVDTALVVINAQTGIELSTERMMRFAAARVSGRSVATAPMVVLVPGMAAFGIGTSPACGAPTSPKLLTAISAATVPPRTLARAMPMPPGRLPAIAPKPAPTGPSAGHSARCSSASRARRR